MKWVSFFLSIFAILSVSLYSQPAENELPKVAKLFEAFVGQLKPADLGVGTCVQNSSRFYEKLLESHIDTKKARLVLLVREPNRGMPQPMYPNAAFIRGEVPKFWIWHAFVTFDGVVFDANYTRDNDSLAVYVRNLWGKDPSLESFWVFSVQYQDLPKIAGSDYPGGPPRMLKYKPITVTELIRNPLHLTVPRS